MDETDVAFDEILERVGNDGKFQHRFNYIFNMAAMVFASMSYMNIILAINAPPHTCHVPGRENFNITDDNLWRDITLPKKENNRKEISHDTCHMYNLTADMYHIPYSDWNFTDHDIIECVHGHTYDKEYYDKTPITEHDWVCEKSHQETNVFVATRIGEIVGTFVFGQLGDTLGRRPVFYISTFTIIFGRVLCTFTASLYYVFLVAAFLGSLTSMSIFQAPLIIAMEISKSDDRASISMKQFIGWTIGMIILPLVFWVTRDWFWFLLITTIPCIIFVFLPKYLIESPRWLASKGHYGRCVVELKRIAKINGREDFDLNEKMLKNMLSSKHVEKVYGMASLFSSWRIAKNAILVTVSWSICAISYFTLVLNSSRMDGNPFLNFLWQSAIELPAYLIGQVAGDKIGRRFTNAVAFFVAFLLCIPTYFIILDAEYEIYSTTLAVMVKFCISITFFAVNLQAIEIYPTCLRQTGLSFGGIVANGLGVFGPYIVKMGQDIDLRLPFIIIGALVLIGVVTSLLLPETLFQDLPESMEEAQVFGKDQKFFGLPKKPVHHHVHTEQKEEKEEKVEEEEMKLNQPAFSP